MKKRRIIIIPTILTIILSGLLVGLLFAPFMSAKGDLREDILKGGKVEISELGGIEANKMADISILELMKIAVSSDTALVNKSEDVVAMSLTIIFIGLFICFSCHSLFLSFFRRAIGVIFFDFLLLGINVMFFIIALQEGDFPSDDFTWGFGFYLYLLVSILGIICATWLLVEKHIVKKQEKIARAQFVNQPVPQPEMVQPAYVEPAYTEPAYTEPAYTEPAYTEPVEEEQVVEAVAEPQTVAATESGTKFCAFCGNQVKVDAKFCNSCGASLEKTEE